MFPSQTYHPYTHANGFGFENLFRSNEKYRYFLKQYDHFISPVADTLAWCLMPNHINFLVRIKPEAQLRDVYTLKYPEKELPDDEQTLQGLGTIEEFTIRQFGNREEFIRFHQQSPLREMPEFDF